MMVTYLSRIVASGWNACFNLPSFIFRTAVIAIRLLGDGSWVQVPTSRVLTCCLSVMVNGLELGGSGWICTTVWSVETRLLVIICFVVPWFLFLVSVEKAYDEIHLPQIKIQYWDKLGPWLNENEINNERVCNKLWISFTNSFVYRNILYYIIYIRKEIHVLLPNEFHWSCWSDAKRSRI